MDKSVCRLALCLREIHSHSGADKIFFLIMILYLCFGGVSWLVTDSHTVLSNHFTLLTVSEVNIYKRRRHDGVVLFSKGKTRGRGLDSETVITAVRGGTLSLKIQFTHNKTSHTHTHPQLQFSFAVSCIYCSVFKVNTVQYISDRTHTYTLI